MNLNTKTIFLFFFACFSTTVVNAHTNQEAIAWTAQTTTLIGNIDFRTIQQHINASQKYFTRHGWDWAEGLIQKYHVVPFILFNQSIAKTTLIGTPVVLNHTQTAGHDVWKVQCAVDVHYRSLSLTMTQPARLIITLTAPDQSPTSFAIDQIEAFYQPV